MGEMKPADQFTSTEEEVEVDEETLAAIDRGIKAADEGRGCASRRSQAADAGVAYKILFTEDAVVDLDVLLSYIRDDNAAAAERLDRSLMSHVELLQDFPRLGRPVHTVEASGC